MNLFSLADLKALDPLHAADPGYDMARAHARSQLVWLHEKIYGEIRARRWDVYFRPEWSISPAQVSDAVPVVNRLVLRYTKAEYVVRLMQKQFGGPVAHWDELAWLGVGLDAQGVFVEWTIPAAARLDAQNFYSKLLLGAPEKRTLRQILAELGGEGALTLEAPGQELLHVRCARLVDLNMLNATLARFVPGEQVWQITIRFSVMDARLATHVAPDELFYRLAQLYALHQFAAWSPRNNYLDPPHGQSNSGIAP
jgi:hypothetical protein